MPNLAAHIRHSHDNTIILFHKYIVRSLVKYCYRSNCKRVNIKLWFSWTISFSPKKVSFNVLKRALIASFCFVWLICKGLFQIALCAGQSAQNIVANRFRSVTFALCNSLIHGVVWWHAVYTFSHSHFDTSFSCRNRKRKSNLWLHVPKRWRLYHDKQVSQDPSPTATTPTYAPKQPNLQILNSGTPRKKKRNKKKKKKKNALVRCASYSYTISTNSWAVVSVPIYCTSTFSMADNNHSYSIHFLFVKPQSHCHVSRTSIYYVLKRSRTAVYVVKRNENVLHTTKYG